MNRRVFLNSIAAIGTAGITGLAGCGGQSDLEETTIESQTYRSPSRTPTKTNTASASPTPTPETERPVIEDYDVSATPTAGELAVSVEASDNAGLGRAVIRTSVDEVERVLEGRSDSVSTRIQGREGEVEQIHVFLEDNAGNRTVNRAASYVRKYDKIVNTRMDVGAVYISQQGDAFRQHCRDSYEGIEPSVGVYAEDPIPTEISTKHIDQMTGHGINRLVYDYGGVKQDRDRIRELLDSNLIDQIKIEPFYTKTGLLWRMGENWKETVLPEDLTYLHDTIMTRDNIAMIKGRPVVSTWNFTYFVFEADAHEKLMDEFGSYEEFVDDIRSHLRVDGTNPYLIFGKGPAILNDETKLADFVRHFDGITTWFPKGPWRDGEKQSWDSILHSVKKYFENNQQYANNHDMEFTPKIFPGFDDRGTACNRKGIRHIPRSPDRFREILNLAEKYVSSDRLDIATFNGWAEGHQLEPGTFNGTDYGTAYLDIVRQFQQGEDG